MAVHPLLQLSLAKHGKKVVPLDIELDQKQRILIISGPNAGGKVRLFENSRFAAIYAAMRHADSLART